jgi:hypothetical protein
MSGALSIDSPTPTSTLNLKKTPLFNIILIPILQNFAVSLFYQRQNLQSERTVSTDCQTS